MVRHVVLGVRGRATCLRVAIDAEHGEVAGLTRPHPVVGLAAILAHRLWHREHQSQVGEVLVSGGIPLVALIEGVDVHVERLVGLLHRVGHGLAQRVDEMRLRLLVHVVDAEGLQARRDVLLALHERHEHVLVRQLLSIALRHETVEHVVVLGGAVRAYGLEATVVVGEHESVGRHHHAGAESGEVDDIVLYGVGVGIERALRQQESVPAHCLIDLRWQVVERPHALVGP